MISQLQKQYEDLTVRYNELVDKAISLNKAEQYAHRCMLLMEADTVLGRRILVKDDIQRILDINRIKDVPMRLSN